MNHLSVLNWKIKMNMNFKFRQANKYEIKEALAMLKEAAENLKSRKIEQWEFWLNPTEEKIAWIREGFENGEFYFIIHNDKIIGMFRWLDEDTLYWGKEKEKAKYIHSLVVKVKYAGNKIGEKIIEKLSENAKKEHIFTLRLDCNAANRKLCEYYEKQGFTKVREKLMPDSLNNLYEKRLI